MSERKLLSIEVSKGAKIRNRYNQVPHLTQDTNGKHVSLFQAQTFYVATKQPAAIR